LRLARYLTPIVDLARKQGELVVATLNYDLTMEEAASRLGVPLSTGVAELSLTGQLEFGEALVKLLKLHGSIDWVRKPMGGYLQRVDLELDTNPTYTATANANVSEPFIVFGAREKLQAQGPFLDLLAQFSAALQRSEHLVVVGYSFRDEHVNEYISRWVHGDDSRVVTVVNPEQLSRVSDAENYGWCLFQTLKAEPAYPNAPARRGRIAWISERAAVGLRHLADHAWAPPDQAA
jgi:hypothetical protein